MTPILLACVFVGMAAGFRFKVLSLLPLTVLAGGAMIWAGQNQSGWIVLGAAVLASLALQIGYLCGTYAQSVLRHPQPAMAPAPQKRRAYKAMSRAGVPGR